MERVVTDESLIQAIQDASLDSIRDDNPNGAISRKALCDKLEMKVGHPVGEKWAIKRLHMLRDRGIIRATKISSTNIVGDRTVIAAYYVVKDSPES